MRKIENKTEKAVAQTLRPILETIDPLSATSSTQAKMLTYEEKLVRMYGKNRAQGVLTCEKMHGTTQHLHGQCDMCHARPLSKYVTRIVVHDRAYIIRGTKGRVTYTDRCFAQTLLTSEGPVLTAAEYDMPVLVDRARYYEPMFYLPLGNSLVGYVQKDLSKAAIHRYRLFYEGFVGLGYDFNLYLYVAGDDVPENITDCLRTAKSAAAQARAKLSEAQALLKGL